MKLLNSCEKDLNFSGPKKMILFLLCVFAFLTTLVYASETETSDYSLTTNEAGTVATGFKIIANKNMVIEKFGIHNDVDATRCLLRNSSFSLLNSSTNLEGQECVFDSPVNTYAGQVYYILVDNQGSSYNSKFGGVDGSGNKTYFYWEESGYDNGGYWISIRQGYSIVNITIGVQGLTPDISNINCTSCNPPPGDNESPYTTADTTPTFRLGTSLDSNCRIGDKNQNYTDMGSDRDCSTTGEKEHICTLGTADELIYSTDFVYVSCENLYNYNQTWNASVSLEMNITDLLLNQTNALDQGIQDSMVWPGATVYSDQKIYLRSLSNDQVMATVDRIVVYGNQRWIINHVGENELAIGNLFNITPTVYSLEIVNLSLTDIQSQVTSLIDSTKN